MQIHSFYRGIKARAQQEREAQRRGEERKGDKGVNG